MEEKNVGNDRRLDRLCRASTDSVEHRCAHETAVGLCSRSPDARAEDDQLRHDVYRPPAKGGTDGYPDKVAETQNQNANGGELHNVRESAVEVLDKVGKQRRNRERTEALDKSDASRLSNG